MTVGRTFRLALIGAAVVAVAVAVDVLAGVELDGPARGAARALVLLGAVLCTGALYQGWSVMKGHVLRDHLAVVAALVGGALIASSVVSPSTAHVFGNDITATAGLFGLAAALYINHMSALEKEAAR